MPECSETERRILDRLLSSAADSSSYEDFRAIQDMRVQEFLERMRPEDEEAAIEARMNLERATRKWEVARGRLGAAGIGGGALAKAFLERIQDKAMARLEKMGL